MCKYIIFIRNGDYMGLGNFIKRHSGAYRLPESQLNKEEILKTLKSRMPFIVTLPLVETVKVGKGYSTSRSQGGFRQTYYTPAESRKVFRTVNAIITCEPTRIKIHHAKKNGEHMFVKYSDISIVTKLTNGKIKNGVGIELENGKQFKFVWGKDHINAFKAMGFNPEFPVDVFYNLLLGEWKIAFPQNSLPQNNIKSNKTTTKKTKKKKTNTKSKSKTKKDDVNPMQKIKEAKELLDMGAITQEEFDMVKSKYLKDF